MVRCYAILAVLLVLAAAAAPCPRDLVLIPGARGADAHAVEATGAVVNAVSGSGLTAEATPEEQARIRELGFKVQVITHDITGVYAANALTLSPDAWYMPYESFRDTMITIAQNNPGFVKLETLGTSAGSRLLLAMKFSDNPQIHENEPAIHFEGDIHGDEKIGWGVAMEMVKHLAQGYGSDTLVTRLIDTREIWLHPMYNPDGYTSASRYNGHGYDLNRNWGWMWGYEGSSQGPSPFSEPENQALLAYIWRHPQVMFVSFHAGTEYISYPWSCSADSIPEKRLINFLSQRYAIPNSYEYGQGYQGMYPINGSTKDFDYGCGMMGWSIEVHMTKTPPATDIVPTFNRNRTAMLEFYHRAGQGIHGTVTDVSSGQPVHCLVWVSPANWPSYNDATLGDFHRFYLPGTYGVTFSAPGYRDTTVSGVAVPNSGDSAVTVNVQMTSDITAPLFAFRVVYCDGNSSYTARPDPVRALGSHDNVGYPLGNARRLCLDMDRPVYDQSGPDLTVYRSSGSGTALVEGSNSWQGPWTSIGTANNAQTSFDLSSTTLDSVRYIRLTASGTFDFDAVEGTNFTGIAERRLPTATRPPLDATVVRGVLVLTGPSGLGRHASNPLLDVSGRKVADLHPGANSIGHLPAGIYYATSGARGSTSGAQKLIITR